MLERLQNSRYSNIWIFSGNAHQAFAQKVCAYLGLSLGKATVTTFNDGESRVIIDENVRGADVFVIQPIARPVNHHAMELFTILEALKRSSAERITAVIPYHGYARQDRKVISGAPITAKLFADFVTKAGAHRVLTMDLHAGQVQGFYDIPVDNLYASPIMIPAIQSRFDGSLVIVSPDAGGTPRARAYAKHLDASVAIIDKRRDPKSNRVQKGDVMIIGNVAGKDAFILDDMIDTGGTLTLGAETLIEHGARRVFSGATHGIYSGQAVAKIQESCIEHVITTDTLPRPEQDFPKLEVLSVAKLFGEAIARIHTDAKVSDLFDIGF